MKHYILITAIFIFFIVIILGNGLSRRHCIKIAQLKYHGGGDWYANPSSLINLIRRINRSTNLCIEEKKYYVSIGDDLFNYPIVYMTGHGRVFFNDYEVNTLRRYLLSNGFLFADDNYGMDKYFRKQMKKVFPKKHWQRLYPPHPIFFVFYKLPRGIPKIHKHHGGPPQALALFEGKRMIVFYSYNTDLGDGWEDKAVHNDPDYKRELAFQMGVNVIVYALSQ